jgi:glutathionyl-hydroquinone reductase
VTRRIVNNESSEILRMLNTEFNAFCATEGARKLDLYPAPLRTAIDEVCVRVPVHIERHVSD